MIQVRELVIVDFDLGNGKLDVVFRHFAIIDGGSSHEITGDLGELVGEFHVA